MASRWRNTVSRVTGLSLTLAALAACGDATGPGPEELDAQQDGLALQLQLGLGPVGTLLDGVLGLLRLPAPPAPPPPGGVCPPADGTRPDPSLVNTDPFVLARFPLERVYNQLVSTAGTSQQGAALYQQMWDALDTRANAKFAGPHCDDSSPPSLNGFALDCPRGEAALKHSQPASFVPVALFNRFDLAPASGAHCGEYRIVYAMTSGAAGRNFVIFEAALPNPTPRCGLEGCRPIVNFWRQLAANDPGTASGQAALADKLDTFYFRGLPGFRPVLHAEHFGASGGAGYAAGAGQIRTNMFVDRIDWQLREFHLIRSCTLSGCSLVHQPVTVKTNPQHELFNTRAATPDWRAPWFQQTFPDQTSGLVSDDVNQLTMNIDDVFNPGQSTSQDRNEDYEFQLQLGAPPNAFSSAIERKLSALGRRDLTAADVARRATTQSCAGCHRFSNGAHLGGKNDPVWPPSRGFVHVDESGLLSPALWCSFLPARRSVLDGFAASRPRLCSIQLGPVVVVAQGALLPQVPLVRLTVSGKVLGPN